MAHYPPGSPPRQNAVTPSSSQRGRQEMHGHVRNPGGHPYVYQVYGRPESGGFGNFSPVRTRPYSNVSPPSTRSDSVEDSLYASFSPPRRGGALPPPRQHRGAAAGNASIFRPKQGIVIVARNSSSHDDNSSVTCGTKNNNFASPATSTPAPYTRQANEPSIVKPNTAFPCKLHEILSSPKYQDLIAWLPHGRAWRVLKPKVFEEKIIPKFFRSSKYASFMRQVNGWGFRRITTPGPDFNAYWHELFLRGLPDICTKMKRPQKNDPETKAEDPPDFYRLSKFSPLPGPEEALPAVANSSSMSSVSCDPHLSREAGQGSPRRSREKSSRHNHGFAGTDSWDHHTDRSPDVAVNLCDVYDREGTKGNEKSCPPYLSSADIAYLVKQNRALIKQAHNYQEGPQKDGDRT